MNGKKKRWEKERQDQLDEEDRLRREAEQNGWNDGRKPFVQTDLDAVMVMSDKDDSDKAGNIISTIRKWHAWSH